MFKGKKERNKDEGYLTSFSNLVSALYTCYLTYNNRRFLLTWSGLRPGGTHVYSSRAQPESSSDCECLCGSPVDGANGDPLPSNLSDGSNEGSLPPGDGKAGGDRGTFKPPSLVDMPESGHGQLRQTGLKQHEFLKITSLQYRVILSLSIIFGKTAYYSVYNNKV